MIDIRSILYINIFLLTGCTVALFTIGLHHRRYRQFCWLALAYASGGLSVALRMLQWKIPDFFALFLPNLLILLSFLLIHNCFANFVHAGRRTTRVWMVLLVATSIGMYYFLYVHRSFRARALLMGLAAIAISLLTSYVLLRFADADVRTPAIATASLYVAFFILMVIRCVAMFEWGVPRNFFVYSHAHLIGFLGFYILIAGIPMGYFWMASTRQYADQERLAQTDPLTGLPNRRGLEEYARGQVTRAGRRSPSLAVLTIDIDHFKQINDRYGHDAGDAALQMVARALSGAKREQDIVARLGGEEFIVLLTETDRTGATYTAERLRTLIEGLNVAANQQDIRMTASFGVAFFAPGDTFEAVLRRADMALYAAKLAGRNRVVLDREEAGVAVYG